MVFPVLPLVVAPTVLQFSKEGGQSTSERFVNCYIKSSSNNLINENIKTGVPREMIIQFGILIHVLSWRQQKHQFSLLSFFGFFLLQNEWQSNNSDKLCPKRLFYIKWELIDIKKTTFSTLGELCPVKSYCPNIYSEYRQWCRNLKNQNFNNCNRKLWCG